MKFWRWPPLLLFFVFLAPDQVNAAPTITILQLMREGRFVPSLPDATLRRLDGTLARRGLNRGQAFPDNVRVDVPPSETIVLAHGRSITTLEAGSSSTFAATGSVESIIVSAGKITLHDSLDFYHVSGHGVNAAPQGTVYSFEVTSSQITVACTNGTVTASLLGSTGSGQHGKAYLKQIDRISAGLPGRSTISFYVSEKSAVGVASQLQRYRRDAARGDADAEVNLGILYEAGRGVARDYATAVKYYRLAAAQGNASGQDNLGRMYESGSGVEQNLPKAAHYYQLAAAQGNALAEGDLAFMYRDGYGVPRNAAAAVHYFELAAMQGDSMSALHVGEMIRLGEGVKKRDEARAAYYYRLAALHGNVDGEYALGLSYYLNEGVARNYAAAAHYFQLAADAGLVDAQYKLGTLYEYGRGVPLDAAKALHYFELAAANDPDNAGGVGAIDLGDTYRKLGDYAKALRYFQLAARGEFVNGNYAAGQERRGNANLGLMYEEGEGVPKDFATALRYYQLAAADDDPLAESRLGAMYERGEGVTRSYVTSLHYYELALSNYRSAAALGDVDSVDAIANAAAAVARVSNFVKRGTRP